MQRLGSLALSPARNVMVPAHPLPRLLGQLCRRIEVLCQPIRLSADVIADELRDVLVVQGGIIRVDGHAWRSLHFAGQSATWTTLLALFPPIDPVEIDNSLAAASPTQHVAAPGKVDRSFHDSLSRRR